mmetsp:Transcript_16226/g.33335  ORF Transcript_16226/g.33335 Transcript_16226/m.33335 type:complete len:231 (-) Transcript_16226:701-1393(-)
MLPVMVSLSWAMTGLASFLMSTFPSMALVSLSSASSLWTTILNFLPWECLAVSGMSCSSVALLLKTDAAASSSSQTLLSSVSASQSSLLCCCLVARAFSRPSSTRARSPCMRRTSSADKSWPATWFLSSVTRSLMAARSTWLRSSSAERDSTFFSRAALWSLSCSMSWWNFSRSEERSSWRFSSSGRALAVWERFSMLPTMSSFSTAIRSHSCSTSSFLASNFSINSSSS